MMFRLISVQEANLLLPFVKEHFAMIQSLVVEGHRLQLSLESKPAPTETTTLSVGLIDELHREISTPVSNKKERDVLKKITHIEEQIREELVALQRYGAMIKAVHPARVEFLSRRHDEVVVLSWKAGDRAINHWRFLDENFTMRRRIKLSDGFVKPVIH